MDENITVIINNLLLEICFASNYFLLIIFRISQDKLGALIKWYTENGFKPRVKKSVYSSPWVGSEETMVPFQQYPSVL